MYYYSGKIVGVFYFISHLNVCKPSSLKWISTPDAFGLFYFSILIIEYNCDEYKVMLRPQTNCMFWARRTLTTQTPNKQTLTRWGFWLSGQTPIGLSWVFFGPQGPPGTTGAPARARQKAPRTTEGATWAEGAGEESRGAAQRARRSPRRSVSEHKRLLDKNHIFSPEVKPGYHFPTCLHFLC